uniref:Uncharacterized protein n=1 Tax=Sphaerodactylus townsendi TaxID=933632 RepID=A0ACB8FRD0_9SAUR
MGQPLAGGTADCYQITTAVIAGIVAGDILLTVLLLIPVYYCTRQRDTSSNKTLNKKGEGKDYMNMTGI